MDGYLLDPLIQAVLIVAVLAAVTWYFVTLALPMAAGFTVALLVADSVAPLNAIYLGVLTACGMWSIYAFAFRQFTGTAMRRALVVFYGLMTSIWSYMLVSYALEGSTPLHPELDGWGATVCSIAIGVVSIARLTTSTGPTGSDSLRRG
jgi:hypothetical protein